MESSIDFILQQELQKAEKKASKTRGNIDYAPIPAYNLIPMKTPMKEPFMRL